MIAPDPWDIREACDRGWVRYRCHRAAVLLALVFAAAAPSCVGTSGDELVANVGAHPLVVGAALAALAALVSALGLLVLVRVTVDAAADRPPTLANVLASLRRFPSLVVAFVACALIVAPLTALLVVPGIYATSRLVFVPFFVVDERMGPFEAIAASHRVTRDNAWTVFRFRFWSGVIAEAKAPLFLAAAEAPAAVAVALATLYLRVSGKDVAAAPLGEPPQITQLACPRCTEPLAVRSAPGVSLLGCSSCGGVFADSAVCRRMIEELDLNAVSLADALASGARSTDTRPDVACPVCASRTRRVVVAGTGVEVDACEQHGTWFDREELRVVALSLERARGGAALTAPPDDAYARAPGRLAADALIAAAGSILRR